MAVPEYLEHIFETEAQYQMWLRGEVPQYASFVAQAQRAVIASPLPPRLPPPVDGVIPPTALAVSYVAPDVSRPGVSPIGPVALVPLALLSPALKFLVKSLLARGVVGLGALRALVARYGPTFLRYIIPVGAIAAVIDLVNGDAPDETEVKLKKRRKRLSIGRNPRVATLLRVAKRVDNLFASYDRRISKFRSRIRGSYRTRRYSPPHRRYRWEHRDHY